MDERAERRARMLEKVRKLLSMARDGRGNKNEEEIAMRQASRLMAEWGIEDADVAMHELESGQMVFGESKVRADGSDSAIPLRKGPVWCGVLAVGVARFTDSVVIRKSTPTEGEVMVFRGEKNDVLLARWLFGTLVAAVQIERSQSGWSGRTDVNAFHRGAAAALQTRMYTLARERRKIYEEAASSSRALVVVDRKMAVIAERFGKQHTRPAGGVCGNDAYGSGKAAGERINIPSGRPIEGGSAPRLR